VKEGKFMGLDAQTKWSRNGQWNTCFSLKVDRSNYMSQAFSRGGGGGGAKLRHAGKRS
jgi:hypothetical protein